MLTTMTTTENLFFVNFVGVKRSCFKMKSDVESIADERKSPPNNEEQIDVTELLERLGLEDIDYDDSSDIEKEWSFPETECTERASRHLSGGGLCKAQEAPTANPAGRTTPSGTSTEEVNTSNITNPFKNHMRLVLEEDDDYSEEALEDLALSSTNPFVNFTESSLDESESSVRRRTASQCSTRAVSPSSSDSSFRNPFQSTPRPNSFIFALPAPPTISQATQTVQEPSWLSSDQSEDDLRCLQSSIKDLQMSGWYHENVNWQDSIALLQDTEPGTFFVRDSSDPNFLFSLSLQTARGPTSVRLHYVNGRFRLDAEEKLVPDIPAFQSVIELIEYYTANSEHKNRKKSKRKTKEQVWVDVHGQVYSNILLTKPLLKKGKVPKLQHLCRLQVNSMLRRHQNLKTIKPNLPNLIPVISTIDSLALPEPIRNFLKEYPFSK